MVDAFMTYISHTLGTHKSSALLDSRNINSYFKRSNRHFKMTSHTKTVPFPPILAQIIGGAWRQVKPEHEEGDSLGGMVATHRTRIHTLTHNHTLWAI